MWDRSSPIKKISRKKSSKKYPVQNVSSHCLSYLNMLLEVVHNKTKERKGKETNNHSQPLTQTPLMKSCEKNRKNRNVHRFGQTRFHTMNFNKIINQIIVSESIDVELANVGYKGM